jgi:N-acetyl-anhydromuramyl-L-alanine amidase AmpD
MDIDKENNPKQICLHKLFHHNKEDFHFLILKAGTIETMKPIENTPINSAGHNKDVVAIGLEGNFIIDDLTEQQLISLKVLLLQLCKTYKIDTTMHHIFCHCDYRDPPGDRLCPGKFLHRRISGIAKELYLSLGRGFINDR